MYVADGSGSGDWKSIITHGWEYINHDGTSQNLTSGSFIDLENAGTGSATDGTYKLPGAGSVWNTTDNQFEWDTAGLVVGDTVEIRFDYEVTVDTNNDGVTLALDVAHGHANEFQLVVDESNFDTAGTHSKSRWFSLYIGSTPVLENPTKVVMSADSANDSVEILGFYVKLCPRNPVFS